MANRIQLRRDGAQQWANVNPILAQGELGIEIDTSRLKIGDGVTAWNSLRYERPIETESNTANTLVKRDADGNFEAGAITASLVGNAATATRLANARQIALGGDMSGSGTFDGSSNLTITSELNYVPTLPHYDSNDLSATGTYSQVTIDSRGRIINADTPTSLGAYGITDAQPLDSDLTSLAAMTTFGILSRQAEGTIVSRTITGGSGRIIIQNGSGQTNNPFVDLADTTVVVGSYNPIGNLDTPLISATTGDETVNTTNFTVDRYGRLTYAQTSAIATAKQGTKQPAYDAGTAYPRYSIIKNSSDKLYQSIADIGAGAGEPTHTDTSDAGSWRYLSSAVAPQKGIASFAQEDFDVTSWLDPEQGGHVTIAERGVDNLQLQNNRVSFADGNTKEDFELDQELTATTGYRGFNYLNYTKVNDTTGNLLVGANNVGNGNSGGTQQAVEYVTVTVGTDTVGGQATGVFYLNGVESPAFPLKRGIKYIFNQDEASNATFNSMAHPIMVSPTTDGEHNGGDHYMMGITYKLDGVVTSMMNYADTANFQGATNRTMEWLVQEEAPATLYYWCHHHTGQGDSFPISDGGAGELDVNVRSYFSHPDITLDGAITQTFDKTGSGHLNFQLTQDTTHDRNLGILSTNSGAGEATLSITADNDITISATNVANRVHVEDYWFQDNTLSTTNATLILDPNDDDDVTGLVQIRGDLQVDGTTTTVNSTVVTIDDPIFTLGGDTAPVADDNKDRGIEFRYYDGQARLGFFGWDEDYQDSNIWPNIGGFRFVYNATNTNEVFTGTDAALIAGNLRLTTNTGSTSTTTGTLVVTGGLGLSENAHIGGEVTIAGQTEINDTVLIKSDNEDFKIQTAAGVDKFTVDTDTGNTVIEGTVDIQLETTVTDNVIIKADNKKFDIQTAAGVSVFDVDTDNGNTHTDGTLDVDSGVTFNSTLDVDDNTTLNAELDVDGDVVFHNDFLMDVTGKEFKITNGTATKFLVSTTNGNTDIEGTVNINSLATFEKTTNITVDTSADDAITQTATGSVDIDGGLNVDADLRVGGDLYVSDRIDSKDAGTARTRPSLLNNLDVRYREYIGSVAAHNADFANDPDANLRVAGGAGIVADLHVGDDFYVGKVATNDNVEFSVLGESGFTTIGRAGQGNATDGAIIVHGDATFNREVNITGALTTIGDANTDVLTVNAVSQFTDNVTVDGDLTVNSNALVEGNLTVNGTTTTVNSTVVTVDDPVFTLGGDTAPGSNDAKDRGIEFRYYDNTARVGFFGWDQSAARYAFYHAATNTSESFDGTRSGLDVGSIKLFDTTNATTSSTGALIVGGGAGIGLDLHVGDDLVVGDAGSFGGNVDITGTLDVTNDFAVSNKFSVASSTGNTNVEGTLTVDGNVTLGNASNDNHIITGTVTFNQAVTSTDITADQIQIGVDAANEISTTSGNLILDSDGGTVNVTDDLDVDNNLNVDGNTKVDGTLTVDGNTTIGNASGDSHSVTGTVQFNQAITSTDITADSVTIGVDSDSEISTTTGNNLILDSATGETQVDDNLTVTGTLDVNGNTQIGNASGDAHAFTGTVTFNQAITSTDITADNVRIGVAGASEIDTASGNLTLDSSTGETVIDDNVTVNGTADIDGLTTITDGLTVKADNKLVVIQNAAGLTKFEIDTDNGNTDIQGTVNIEGATTVDDTLNVTQATDLDSTLNVDGAATFQDNVVLNADNKEFAIQLDDGTDKFTVQSASGNTDIQGTLDVNGATNVTNTLGVTGVTSITDTTNPANLIATAALNVSGGAVIEKDVFFGEDFYMGPNNAPTLSVIGASGNTSITGTLNVTNTTTLGTAGISTLNLTNNANISGSIIVNTDKFIVAGLTGNTDIFGTLDVGGATVIDDTLNVTQGVDFDSTLNVDGNSTFSGTITQNSTSLFKDNIILRGASKTLILQNGSSQDKITLASTSGNITASGTADVGALDVTNNTTIGGTLGVTGQITGDVTGDLTGNADTASLVSVTETATSNLTYYPTFVSANTGNTEIRTDSGQLTYNPSDNRLTVTNFKSTTDFEVAGNLNITGNITYTQSQVGSIANHDTDALTEGSSNLYFTNERVDDRVNNLINAGTGISATYDDAGNMLTLSAVQSDLNTDNFTEGSTNLFTTAARTRTHFTYGNGVELSGGGELSVTQADINTDNVTEGSTNLFTTAARTRGHVSATGDLSYNASTGVFSYTTPTTIASLSNHDTDDLAEGNNLYYTDERVDDRINALIIAGTGVTKVYDDGANTYTLSVTQADVNSDNITEGSTNLFTTAARTRTHFTYGTGISHSGGTLSVTQSDIDTDNVTEGSTNLFTTAARTRGHISVSGDLAYNSGTGVISFTERTDAEVNTLADARIAAADTDDLSEGSSNLYHTTARARGAISAGGDLAYNSSTGVMSVTLPTVFSGDYDDLTNKPTLGTAAATASTAYATAAQGTTADNALAASAVSTFGGTLIDDADAATARATLGLGTAATTASTAYATAAQGATADSALQAETITLATLKSVTAASTDFADFQTRIAAL